MKRKRPLHPPVSHVTDPAYRAAQERRVAELARRAERLGLAAVRRDYESKLRKG